MSDNTIEEKIEEATATPASMSVDGMSKSSRSIPDLIAADKYLKQQEAVVARPARMGFRMGVFRAPEHY
jgi:hypothetical protein